MNETGEFFILETTKSLRGLKSLAEKAIEQISEDELHYSPDEETNSVALIVQHMSGNMISRFTDFLTTDGEKPWRKRDDEFIDQKLSRSELMKSWNLGWECLLDAMGKLKAGDLLKNVSIRGEEQTVLRALQRQLVHYAYHTGQIVFHCKQIKRSDFKSLSIPRGESNSYVPGDSKK